MLRLDHHHFSSATETSRPISKVAIAVSIGVILVLLWGLSTLSSWRRLRHIPGPPTAGVSKWWMLRKTMSGKMHLALKDVVKEFGPLVRIGPNTLVTSDPDVLRRMWAVRSPYLKGPFYQAVRFDPERDNIISMRDDTAHGVLRAKMAAGYAGKDNDGLEGTIDRGVAAFVELIERKYVSDEMGFRPMDLARKAQYMTLDVISMLALGERFGFTDEDADVHRYIEILEGSMPVMLILSVFPALARLVQSRLCRQLLPSERDKVGLGVFIGVAKQIVADRLASANPFRKDMLGSFLAHGLTREEAEGEMLVQIVAGSDTTATAVRATMLYVMSSPAVYARLVAEIRTWAASESGNVNNNNNNIDDYAASAPAPPPISDADARALPYLQAVIREGLRMHPPVVGLMGVVVPPGGDVLCGFAVPEGTEVGWSAWGLQRSVAVYGSDADCFRPERWLEAAGSRLRAMAATCDLVFKFGKWQCLGKPVAMIELNKVFVELFRRYDFALVDAAQPMKSYSAGIFLQSGLMVKVTRAHPAGNKSS